MEIDHIPIINVDANGFDKDGFDYIWTPSASALAEGLVASRNVILRYPDGSTETAIEVLITKKGFGRLSADIPVTQAIGEPIGTA